MRVERGKRVESGKIWKEERKKEGRSRSGNGLCELNNLETSDITQYPQKLCT